MLRNRDDDVVDLVVAPVDPLRQFVAALPEVAQATHRVHPQRGEVIAAEVDEQLWLLNVQKIRLNLSVVFELLADPLLAVPAAVPYLTDVFLAK